MNLRDIVERNPEPEPWVEGEKIPWNDPEWSERMLAEHLCQAHDAASRRKDKIEKHVAWIHREVLAGRRSAVLDLGCGPGLYSVGLAQLGHRCRGVDFSPASIRYAKKRAKEKRVDCAFELADMREASFGSDLDLVMLIYGEFNVFRKEEAIRMVERAAEALRHGGTLLLEPNEPLAAGEKKPRREWWTATGGLFGHGRHLVLFESTWNAESRISTERYYTVDAGSCSVRKMAQSVQEYSEEEYRRIFLAAGFRAVEFHPSLSGRVDPAQKGLCVITARK